MTPAIRPMITTTIMISISEKALRAGKRRASSAAKRGGDLTDRIARLQNGKHCCQDDEQDDRREHEDDRRLEDRRQALRRRLHALIVACRETIEHLFEAAGLLAHRAGWHDNPRE